MKAVDKELERLFREHLDIKEMLREMMFGPDFVDIVVKPEPEPKLLASEYPEISAALDIFADDQE